jgi:hypothetical protein
MTLWNWPQSRPLQQLEVFRSRSLILRNAELSLYRKRFILIKKWRTHLYFYCFGIYSSVMLIWRVYEKLPLSCLGELVNKESRLFYELWKLNEGEMYAPKQTKSENDGLERSHCMYRCAHSLRDYQVHSSCDCKQSMSMYVARNRRLWDAP